jgi:integrase
MCLSSVIIKASSSAKISSRVLMSTAPKTTSNYRAACKSLVDIIGDKPIDQYTAHDIDIFLIKKRNSSSIASARCYYAALSSIFETARRWGYISHNQWRQVRRPDPGNKTPAYFTVPQFRKFLRLIDDERFRDLVIVGFYTGLRSRELRRLTWDDVDLNRRIITIQNTEASPTKNKRSRAIPIHNDVVKVLRIQTFEAGSDLGSLIALGFAAKANKIGGRREPRSEPG